MGRSADFVNARRGARVLSLGLISWVTWIGACGDDSSIFGGGGADSDDVFQSEPNVVLSTAPTNYTLQILHAADQEAGTDAVQFAPRFSSVINGLEPEFANTVKLTSGDLWIPGAFYSATGGEADVRINSAIFDAAVLGNHEFDLGTDPLAGLIEDFAEFPYISSNLDFSTDSNLSDLIVPGGQEVSTIPNSVTNNAVITVNGETIGLVGATTPLIPSISSPGDVTVFPSNPEDLGSLAAIIQQEVDTFTAQGIDKVILLAHLQQLSNEITLASLLRDVDVIIAGGSDTLLANPDDRILTEFEKTPSGVYPLLYNSASGQPVAVVNTDREYRYVGRLVLGFDAAGVIATIDEVSGPYPADDQGVIETGSFPPDPEVVAAVDDVAEVLLELDGTFFGETTVFINGERQDVRTRETNMGNLTADANLAFAQAADPSVVASIKNGGGIRASIGSIEPGAEGNRVPPAANPLTGKEAGQISQLDIQNTLRFNNGLTLLTLTAAQFKEVVEHGVAQTEPGATPGRFPQIGGFSFSYDPGLPPGSRVLSLTLDSGEAVVSGGAVVNPGGTYRIVTLNFLADGGDDYPYPDFEATSDRVDLLAGDPELFETPGGEQNALAEFLTQIGTFTEPDPIDPADRERIIDLSL